MHALNKRCIRAITRSLSPRLVSSRARLLISPFGVDEAHDHPRRQLSHTPFEGVEHYIANRPDSEVYSYPLSHGVRAIVLNRPKQLNALTLPMIRQLSNIITALEKDKDVSLATMSGVGGKAYCAGGDVVALYHAGLRRKQLNNHVGEEELTKRFFRDEYTLNFKLSNTRVPIMAVMNGITMGGGVGISAHCRYRSATPQTLFAMPECAIGFFPDVGASFILPRLGGSLGTTHLGMFLGLTGHRLKGIDALHCGLATHFTTMNQGEYEQNLSKILISNGLTHQQTEDALEMCFFVDSEEYINDHSEFSLERDLTSIDYCFSAPSVEGIMERLANESSPVAQSALKAMKSASPTSLKVTFRQLTNGSTLSLEQCLAMEYRISQRMMLGHDFYAGVDAALISKHKAPKWSPERLEDVTDDMVNQYFAPMENESQELYLEYPKFKEAQWYF